MAPETKIERHKNYQDLAATVENPKLYFSGAFLRNSRHPYAADGIKVKTGQVERFSDMIDFEGAWVNDENRNAWENLRARIRQLHEDGLIEVDEKGYPINPNRWAHDIEGMGELWEWGPIVSATAAVTTKIYNSDTGQEDTYLWCVRKEGENEWRLPGGVQNKGEDGNYTEKLPETARRELLEESGLQVSFTGEDIKFSGPSTGGRQTKHSWFVDVLFQLEISGGLDLTIEKGSDMTGYFDPETGRINELGEIAQAEWKKLTPELEREFSASHWRMLKLGSIVIEKSEDMAEHEKAETK